MSESGTDSPQRTGLETFNSREHSSNEQFSNEQFSNEQFSNDQYLSQSSSPDNQSDQEALEKICVVCNDYATGYHFNAMTCEGCKGFFRRTVKNKRNFSCSFENKCAVTRQNRRQCQSCRFHKCLSKGMKRECILSDTELNKKRKIIQKNKMKKILTEHNEMSAEEVDIMEQVVSAYNYVQRTIGVDHPPLICDIRCAEDMPSFFRTKNQDRRGNGDVSHFIRNIESRLKGLVLVYVNNRRTGEADASTVNVNYVRHMSDIMHIGICKLISFSKLISEFACVEQNDQVALIRAAAPEVVLLQAATYYDPNNSRFLSPETCLEYGFEELREIGFNEMFLEKLKIFLHKFTLLDLSKDEFVLTIVLVLFSFDRRGLQNSSYVMSVHESYAILLERAMNSPLTKVKYGRNRFPDIISLIYILRDLAFMAKPLGKALHEQMAKGVLPDLLNEMLS